MKCDRNYSNVFISLSNDNSYQNIYYYLSASSLSISSSKGDWSKHGYVHNERMCQETIKWHHIILSRDSKNKRHYVYYDGKLINNAYSEFFEGGDPIQTNGFVIGNMQYE